jgi:hypothetical protein
MGLSDLFYNLLPQERRDQIDSRKNVKLINEFLRERKKLQVARKADLVRLKGMCENNYIDRDTYTRLKEIMILTHEENRIELINSITRKSAKREVVVIGNSEQEKDEAIEIDAPDRKTSNDGSETQPPNHITLNSTKTLESRGG